MGYFYDLSFKSIDNKDIFDFLLGLKNETLHSYRAISKNINYACPFNHKLNDLNIEEKNHLELWVLKMTSLRMFYISELGLLVVMNVPECLKHNFEKSIIFQNASDIDYKEDEYKGVKVFEDIYDKWNKYSKNEVLNKYLNLHPYSSKEEISEIDNDSLKRMLAYEEIFGLIYPYCEDKYINIGLIDSHNYNIVKKISRLCCEYKLNGGD